MSHTPTITTRPERPVGSWGFALNQMKDAMITISHSRKLVTLINVFTVEPANQERLLDLLTRATETSVRYAPGFISASLHRGLDGTKVTMYAQWRSVEDYEAMRRNPAPLPFLQQALAIAKFDPGMYDVVETFSGAITEP
jgi:quinol monooxygenase YgiN